MVPVVRPCAIMLSVVGNTSYCLWYSSAFIANKSNNASVFLEKDVSKALRNFGVQCIQKTAVVDLDFGVQLEM